MPAKKVLAIVQDVGLKKGLTAVLSGIVSFAPDVSSALKFLLHGDVDLILVEASSSPLCGSECITAIRSLERFHTIPIGLLSLSPVPPLLEDGKGIDAIISPPFDRNAILSIERLEEEGGENTSFIQLVEDAVVPLHITDIATHEILYANKAFCRLIGKADDSYKGQTCHSYLMDRTDACLPCEAEKYTDNPLERTVRNNGRVYHVEGRKFRFRGHDACLQYVSDVTNSENEKQQQSLQLNELNDLVAHIHAGIVVFQLVENALSVLSSNPVIASMVGISEKDFSALSPRRIFQLIHPDDRRKVYAYITDFKQSEDYESLSFRALNVKTHLYSFFSASVSSHVKRGGATYYYVLITDVSIREYLENQLRKANSEARSLVDNAPGGLMKVTYLGGRMIPCFVSKGIASMLGYTRDEFLHMYEDNLHSFIHGNDYLLMVNAERQANENHAGFDTEVRILTGQGKYSWVHIQAAFAPDCDGTPYWYVTFTDINELKRKEGALLERDEAITAAVSHANLYYWDINIDEHVARFGQRMVKDLRIASVSEHYPSEFFEYGFVFPEDIGEYRNNVVQIYNGVPYVEWDCRIKNPESGLFKWRRICMSRLPKKADYPAMAVATSRDVHDLKSFEKRFAQTVQQNGIWAWEIDLANHTMKKLGSSSLTWPQGDFIENVPESCIAAGLFHPQSISSVRRLFDSIYAGRKEGRIEALRWNTTHAGFSWFDISIAVVDDGTGRMTKAIYTSRDISDKKHLEQLYTDEQLYRSSRGDHSLLDFQINMSKGEVEAVHEGTKNVFSEDLKYKSGVLDLLSGFFEINQAKELDVEALSSQNLQSMFRNGIDHFDVSFLTRRIGDAKHLFLHVNCHLVRRPTTGELIAFIYTDDTTDANIINLIASSVIECDYELTGLISSEDRTFCTIVQSEDGRSHITKYSDSFDSFIENTVKPYVRAADVDKAIAPLHLDVVLSKLVKGKVLTSDIDFADDKGGVRKKQFRFAPASAVSSAIVFSVIDIEDIVTRERAKQIELEIVARKARKANAAKSEFLAHMSHEIRTPLNGVLGLAALAKDENDPQRVREYLDQIGVSATHLGALINDILDMSKIESGEIVLHPTAYLYEDFKKEMDAVLLPLCQRKHIRFVCSPDEGIPLIVDKTRFNQIIFNLVSNAIKFTPEYGTVSIDFVVKDTGPGTVSLDVYIKDNGIGMSKEFQKRMFTPFTQEEQQVVSATQGTGLGLGIARAYTHLMGGTIDVKSAKGKGTEFHLRFNLESFDKKEVDVTVHADLDLKGKCILLVEDHPINQLIAQRMLEKKGARVIIARDGREGVRAFQESPEGLFSCILMDIRMPNLDGLGAAKAIRTLDRKDAKTIPIIAMTANAYDEDRKKSFEAGMNAHIAKPLSPEQLYNAMAPFFQDQK